MSDQSNTARMYLHRAASSLAIYGDQDTVGLVTARVYALLAYREGDLDAVLSDIRAEMARREES